MKATRPLIYFNLVFAPGWRTRTLEAYMIVLEHSFPRHCPGESMPLRQNPCCEVTLTQVGHPTGLPKNTGLGEDLRYDTV